MFVSTDHTDTGTLRRRSMVSCRPSSLVTGSLSRRSTGGPLLIEVHGGEPHGLLWFHLDDTPIFPVPLGSAGEASSKSQHESLLPDRRVALADADGVVLRGRIPGPGPMSSIADPKELVR